MAAAGSHFRSGSALAKDRSTAARWNPYVHKDLRMLSNQAGRKAFGDISTLRGVRVLVVEDTWAVAEALRSLLEEIGVAVVGPAATATDADRLLSEPAPQLAIVDLKLKGETSLDLIRRLRVRGIPVVVVSGSVVSPGSTDGVDAILQKPYSEAELLMAMHRVMHGANRPPIDVPATAFQ
jgi:CheY-like chemotaxis protein